MNKKEKLLTAISATAMLSLGMSMTSLAATGWVQENGNWRYYDRDGYYVTNEWKKSNNTWYYLDDDGYMAVNELIEDGDRYYAVDALGAMVKNEWREFASEDDDSETTWYYFQESGKAKDDGFLTIGGNRYHFTDGKMDEGWLQIDDSTYLLNRNHDGTFGAVLKGWAYVDDFDENDDVSADEEGWYYFNDNGKMVKDTEKKINGYYYVFDENGLMLDNWVKFTKPATASSAEDTIYKFYRTSEGQRVDKWVYIDDMSEDEGRETEEGWYYFRSGIPYSSTYKTTAIADGYGVAKINGKVYCFDETGRMVTGKIDAKDGTYFYFDDEDGAMKYGKVKIEDADDLDDGTYYFVNSGSLGQKGVSYTGVYKGYLYDNGALVKAEDGMRYQKVSVNGKNYMVNERGKVITSGTVKDSDGYKWKIEKTTTGDYIITEVN